MSRDPALTSAPSEHEVPRCFAHLEPLNVQALIASIASCRVEPIPVPPERDRAARVVLNNVVVEIGESGGGAVAPG